MKKNRKGVRLNKISDQQVLSEAALRKRCEYLIQTVIINYSPKEVSEFFFDFMMSHWPKGGNRGLYDVEHHHRFDLILKKFIKEYKKHHIHIVVDDKDLEEKK